MDYWKSSVYCSDVEKTLAQIRDIEYFQDKRVLILGATGLIGSYLTDCLLYANRALNMQTGIYAVGRSRERLAKRFGEESRYLQFVESNVEQLEFDGKVDIIIHAASNAHPRAFRENPVETMMANLQGVYRVCELAKSNPGCRVLYVSSGEAQEEVDHLTTRACYPISKKAAETLCLCYAQEYNVDVVIARPCHTFGANVTVEDNRATAQFISCAVCNQDIIMNSDGRQRRSFSYVGDCVSGLLTVVSCGDTGQVYGVASDEVYSIRRFAEGCATCVGRQVIMRNADSSEKAEASPIPQQIIDNVDLKKLGWNPIFSIKEGIEHSIEIQRQVGEA